VRVPETLSGSAWFDRLAVLLNEPSERVIQQVDDCF
jgi:hypothetical protein